jgi:hypothetical protein
VTETIQTSTKFKPLQQELLNLFSMDLSEDELKDIKKLLSGYFWDRLQKNVTMASEQIGYTQDDFDAWLK